MVIGVYRRATDWQPVVGLAETHEVNELPPTPPAIDQQFISQIVRYAEACAAWLEADLREASKHGHAASPEQLSNLDGYRFTALFLKESYDD